MRSRPKLAENARYISLLKINSKNMLSSSGPHKGWFLLEVACKYCILSMPIPVD